MGIIVLCCASSSVCPVIWSPGVCLSQTLLLPKLRTWWDVQCSTLTVQCCEEFPGRVCCSEAPLPSRLASGQKIRPTNVFLETLSVSTVIEITLPSDKLTKVAYERYWAYVSFLERAELYIRSVVSARLD